MPLTRCIDPRTTNEETLKHSDFAKLRVKSRWLKNARASAYNRQQSLISLRYQATGLWIRSATNQFQFRANNIIAIDGHRHDGDSEERARPIASGLFNLLRQRRSLSDLHNFRARERDSFRVRAIALNRAEILFEILSRFIAGGTSSRKFQARR